MWVRQHNLFILLQPNSFPRPSLEGGRERTLGTRLYCNVILALLLYWFSFFYRKLSSGARVTQKDMVYQFAKLFSTYFARYEEWTPETMIAKSINKVIYINFQSLNKL